MKKLLVVTGILVAFGAVLPGVAGAQAPGLVVQTVPAVKGVVFTVADHNYVTDADGIVRINDWSPGEALELKTPEVTADGLVARFERWGDSTRGLTIEPTNDPVQVGFDLYYRMARRFVDPQGHVLDSTTISAVQIERSDTMMIDPTTDCGGSVVSPCLLVATGLLNTREGLKTSPVRYQVPTVTRVDGLNIAAGSKVNDFWPCDQLRCDNLKPAHVVLRDS
jgi:hypothetical protein